MTEAEKNEIVGLVMNQISSQAVDFDIETEQPQANDLLTAVRETSPGVYEGVTIKWCSGRVGMTRTEIADKHHVSERTLDREYADARKKILYACRKYEQEGFRGRFFFELDEKMNGTDWSKYTKKGS